VARKKLNSFTRFAAIYRSYSWHDNLSTLTPLPLSRRERGEKYKKMDY